MYIAIMVATILVTISVYKYYTARTEREQEDCLNYITIAAGVWMVVIGVSIGLYMCGYLTGPLSTFYKWVADTEVLVRVWDFLKGVFTLLLSTTVRTTVQYVCLFVCAAAPIFCFWKYKKRNKEGGGK